MCDQIVPVCLGLPVLKLKMLQFANPSVLDKPSILGKLGQLVIPGVTVSFDVDYWPQFF